MKNLLSDELVAKYRSVPDLVWYLFAALSVFFAKAYDIILSAGVNVKTVNDSLAGIDVPMSINPVVFIVLTCVFSAVFSTLVFEIINHIASGVLLVRFGAKTNRSDLKFRLRLCYVYSNLLTGLIGIAYFFTQVNNGNYTGVFTPYEYLTNDVQTIIECFLPYSSVTFFVFLFFEDTRARFIPKRKQLSAFTFIAGLYFGISVAVTLIANLVIIRDARPLLYVVTDWVDLGVKVLWALGAFLYYRNLKKKLSNNDDDDRPGVTVIIEDAPKKNIYDDFGF